MHDVTYNKCIKLITLQNDSLELICAGAILWPQESFHQYVVLLLLFSIMTSVQSCNTMFSLSDLGWEVGIWGWVWRRRVAQKVTFKWSFSKQLCLFLKAHCLMICAISDA